MVWKGCWMKAGYLLNWPFFESLGLCQFGGEGWKILSVGHCFSSIFKNSRKNNGQAFSVTFAQRPTWMSPGPGPHFKCSKTVEVRCSCYELKHCQREITTDYHDIQEKNYGEHSNIKAGASVHWLGQCHTKWLRGCSKFQNSAPIDPIYIIWLVIFHKIELIFCMQNCHCWIALVEYQDKTRYTRILDCKPFIDIYLSHLT